MNSYQITLSSGAVLYAMAENYNADPVAGLQLLDQFGNAVQVFAPGTWTGIQIAPPVAVPPGISTMPAISGAAQVTDGDTNEPG